MSWVFEFHRQDGRSFKFDRMNPNITDLAMVLAGLKPLLYSHVAQDEVVWIRSLLDFFDLEYQLKRRKNPGSNNAWDLFAGLKGAPLKRAVELSRAGKVREPDLEWSALLGYPSCCTRAFAKNFKGSDPGRDVVPFIYKQTTRKTALPFYLNNIFNYSTRLNGTKK